MNCELCGSENDLYSLCGTQLCVNCGKKLIHEHDYVPDFLQAEKFRRWKGSWPKELTFGFELEVQRPSLDDEEVREYDEDMNPDDEDDVANVMRYHLNKSALKAILASKDTQREYRQCYYCKLDGSVSNGFEVVSRPANLNWILGNVSMLQNMSKALRNDGFKSWDATNQCCGLHIHASKDYFSSFHLYKLLKLVYEADRSFWDNISGRSSSNLGDWASTSDWGRNMRISVAKKKNGNDSRYYAINCLPKHSIELRIFRGTLVSETVMGCILFYAAMILFTKNASLKDCNITQLRLWIHEHQKDYKSAITMLNGRGITV